MEFMVRVYFRSSAEPQMELGHSVAQVKKTKWSYWVENEQWAGGGGGGASGNVSVA
jgi:hypothetical protein